MNFHFPHPPKTVPKNGTKDTRKQRTKSHWSIFYTLNQHTSPSIRISIKRRPQNSERTNKKTKKTKEAYKIGKIIFKPILMRTKLGAGKLGKYALIDAEKYHLLENLPRWNTSSLNIASGRGRILFNNRGKKETGKNEIRDSTTQGNHLSEEEAISLKASKRAGLVAYEEIEHKEEEKRGYSEGDRYDSDRSSAFSDIWENRDIYDSDSDNSDSTDGSQTTQVPRRRSSVAGTLAFLEFNDVNENNSRRYGYYNQTQMATSLNIKELPEFVMFTPTPQSTPFPPTYNHTQEAVRHGEEGEWIRSEEAEEKKEADPDPKLRLDLEQNPTKVEIILDYVKMILQHVTELQDQTD